MTCWNNGGRRSPRELTPGLDRLEVGQRLMRIFRVVSFDRNDHITMLLDDPRGLRLFGDVSGSYAVRDAGGGTTRLVAKLWFGPGRGPAGLLRARLLPWGDALMMRKQLLTLKSLAEQETVRSGRPVDSDR